MLNNLIISVNLIRFQQFENYQRRSLVAIRYVAQAAPSVCVTCGVG
jgi:hypothetical protein